MSNKKKINRTKNQKKKLRKVTRLSYRQPISSATDLGRKLSEIIKEIALQSLKDPDAIPTQQAMSAALILASSAWNSAIGDNAMLDQHHKTINQIDWDDVKPWAELRMADTEQLIAELGQYKREHYPNDLRRVVAIEMTPEGNARVHWTEFVFEAYVNHRPNVIFLKGLPDIPASRPHSSVNSP